MLLHPIERQPFLQWHGELIREVPPVVVSHLILKSLKDLKLNTTQAASKNRTGVRQGVSSESLRFLHLATRGHAVLTIFTFIVNPLKFPNLWDIIIYLVEHVSEIVLRIHPGSHCITEEYKILFQRRDASTFTTANLNVQLQYYAA